MLTPMSSSTVSKVPGKLASIYEKLNDADRQNLMAFAEFLLQRGSGESATHCDTPEKPNLTPRPESESVVSAIKRLTDSYPMLERQQLFSKTSELMSAHLLQGKSAESVIDELEAVFLNKYQDYLDTYGRE